MNLHTAHSTPAGLDHCEVVFCTSSPRVAVSLFYLFTRQRSVVLLLISFLSEETKTMLKKHNLTRTSAQPRSLFLSESVTFWRSSQKMWLEIVKKDALTNLISWHITWLLDDNPQASEYFLLFLTQVHTLQQRNTHIHNHHVAEETWSLNPWQHTYLKLAVCKFFKWVCVIKVSSAILTSYPFTL